MHWGPSPAQQRRARIVLAVAAGETYAGIQARMHCSSKTIARYTKRFRKMPGRTLSLRGDTPRRKSPAIAEREAARRKALTTLVPTAKRDGWSRRILARKLGVSPMTISRLLRKLHAEGGTIESLDGNRADYDTFPLRYNDEGAIPIAAFFSRTYQALAFIVVDEPSPDEERDLQEVTGLRTPWPSEIVTDIAPYQPERPIRGWNREVRLLCAFIIDVHDRWRHAYVLTWNLTPKRRAIVRAAIRRRWGLTVLRVNRFERWISESRVYAGVRLIRPGGAMVPEPPQQRAVADDAARQRSAYQRLRLGDLTPGPELPRIETWDFPWKEGVRKAISASNKMHAPLVWFQPPEDWDDPRDN
jgi:transposase